MVTVMGGKEREKECTVTVYIHTMQGEEESPINFLHLHVYTHHLSS